MTRWLLSSGLIAFAVPARAEQPAHVTVMVPVGATLTINGVKTDQMTGVRQFVTPPLPEGKRFEYEFRAAYTWFGEPVQKKHRVVVEAGRVTVVDMTTGEDVPPPPPFVEPVPAPPPPKDPPKKVNPKPPPVGGEKPEPKKAPDPAKQPVPDPNMEGPLKDPKKNPPEKKPDIIVPYVPTPKTVVAEMLRLGSLKAGEVAYDLGCGDGRIVVAAVRDFKAKKGVGIDFDPKRIEESVAAAKKSKVEDKTEFRTGDVLKLAAKDFEGIDVVTLYLLPEVNLKLQPILLAGLKPGSRVVSHAFEMGADWKPAKSITVTDDDGEDHELFLYVVPEKKK